MDIPDIAKIVHQANKAYCEAIGDNSQPDWKDAPEWQRQSAFDGVRFRIDNPGAPESAQHEAWMKDKLDSGWKYGEIKDARTKTHPCLVPFEDLPRMQQLKDALVVAIIDTLI